MMQAWSWLESTALAAGLRDSVWAYPLVSATHILGVALLIGAIVPLDLRLLGLWRTVPVPPLWRIATRTAAWGFALAASCGLLLFSTRATEYVASPYFLAKMALLLVAALNALLLARRVARHPFGLEDATQHPPACVRFAAAVSLGAWVGVLFLGRLIGYF